MVWIRICRAQKGRRETVEGSSKDRRGITNLGVENQQLAILYDSRTQCAGFQEVCNCYIEGTKWYAVGLADNPRRREKECVNVGMRECGNVVIIHFCVYCENIGAFCEIAI